MLVGTKTLLRTRKICCSVFQIRSTTTPPPFIIYESCVSMHKVPSPLFSFFLSIFSPFLCLVLCIYLDTYKCNGCNPTSVCIYPTYCKITCKSLTRTFHRGTTPNLVPGFCIKWRRIYLNDVLSLAQFPAKAHTPCLFLSELFIMSLENLLGFSSGILWNLCKPCLDQVLPGGCVIKCIFT